MNPKKIELLPSTQRPPSPYLGQRNQYGLEAAHGGLERRDRVRRARRAEGRDARPRRERAGEHPEAERGPGP